MQSNFSVKEMASFLQEEQKQIEEKEDERQSEEQIYIIID